MKSGLYVIGLVTSVVAFVTACAGDNDNAKRKKFFGPGSGNEFTTVDVEAASSEEDSGLSLAGEAAESLKLKVSCDGITEEIVEDSKFDLPVGQKNCKAKLVSIKIGDKTYVEPAGGSGFDHYLKNDRGRLVNQADSKDILYVRVKRQLPSPLTANANVEYVYSAVTQFDTIEASTAEVAQSASASTVGEAPKVKAVKAMINTYNELVLHIECTASPGFQGATVDVLTCEGKKLADMKFATAIQDEGTYTSATRLAAVMRTGKAAKQFGRSSYVAETKQVYLNFGSAAERKTRIFVASLTSGTNVGYAFGFIKLNGTSTHSVGECQAQGSRANFVEGGIRIRDNVGRWEDTSNCWVWMRPETGKVSSRDRFKTCPKITNDATPRHLTLPYFTEIKAARDRNIQVIGKGAAPKLGATIDEETFWLAGGRVFNMKDGTVRELKDIKPGEKHSVLCVKKKD
jgi:hypothetical protein